MQHRRKRDAGEEQVTSRGRKREGCPWAKKSLREITGSSRDEKDVTLRECTGR